MFEEVIKFEMRMLESIQLIVFSEKIGFYKGLVY